MTPFRSEKNTNWEGAFRVPGMIRWPGKIKAGKVSNEIVQHHDWLPTFLAMAGDPDIVDKLKSGSPAGDKNYKVHIDGYNLVPYLTGSVEKSPRPGFIYFQRRRRRSRIAVTTIGRSCSWSSGAGDMPDLGRAVHRAARAEDVQPAHGSVRARGHHVEHLLRLAGLDTSTS